MRRMLCSAAGVVVFLMLSLTMPQLAGATRATHFIYVSDGTSPDGIDVYSYDGTTASLLQHVTIGNVESDLPGDNFLTLGGTTNQCLVFDDSGDGFLYSYAIASNGTLTPAEGDPLYVLSGGRNISADGNMVAMTAPNRVDIAKLSSRCALTLVGQEYVPEDDGVTVNLSWTSASSLVGYSGSDYLAWRIDKYGGLQ